MWDVMIAYHGTNDGENGSVKRAEEIYEHLTQNGKRVFWFPRCENELGDNYGETCSVAADSRYFLLVVNGGIKETGRHLDDNGRLIASTPIYNEITSFYHNQIEGRPLSAGSRFIVYCYDGFTCADGEKLYPIVTKNHLCMENAPYTEVLDKINECDERYISTICSKLLDAIDDDNPNEMLIASFSCMDGHYNNLGKLIESKRVVDDNAPEFKARHIHISSDGGHGKSTQMRCFARELNQKGYPAVYIDCKKIDQLSKRDEIDGFVVDSIFKPFGDLFIDNRTIDKFAKLKYYVKYTVRSLTIFLDGENEVADGEGIVRQISQLLDELIGSNFIQVIVSSRFLNKTYEGKGMTCARMNPLNIRDVLKDNKDKLEKYYSLNERTREMLLLPMFLKLFIESDDDNITTANLLLRDYERTAEKLPNYRQINVGVVLRDFLPGFAWSLYCQSGKMAFVKNEIEDYLPNSPLSNRDFSYIVSALITASYVVTTDRVNFAFRHEHIRDFLVAYYLKKKLSEADGDSKAETILKLFPRKNMYGRFVLQFFAELMEENGLREALDCLRKGNIKDEDWRSDNTAIATAEIIMAFRILFDGNFEEFNDFTSLNLAETELNEVKVFEANFRNSIIKSRTFMPEGQSTGIFYVTMCQDHIYALGKNELVKYSRNFEKLDSVSFEMKQWNLSSASNSNAIITVGYAGEAFLFNLEGKMTSRSLDFTDAVYVASSDSDFIVGFKNGEMKQVSSDGTVKDLVKVDDVSVLPIYNKKSGRAGVSYYYATGNEIKYYKSGKTGTHWLAPQDAGDKFKITEARAFLNGKMAIVSLSRLGENCVYAVSLEDGSKFAKLDEKYKPSTQRTKNFDPTLCNEIMVCGEYIVLSYNMGDVTICKYDSKKKSWNTFGSINVVNTEGLGVESAYLTKEGIICGLTDRSLRFLSFDSKSLANSGFEKRSISGRHDGLRKIYRVNDNKIIVNTYDGSFVELVRDSTDFCFKFNDKVTPGRKRWSWAFAVVSDSVYFIAVQEKLYLYNDGTITEIKAGFNERIDALLYRENTLIVACSNKTVYRVALDEDYNIAGDIEPFNNDESDRAAICFTMHPQTGEIYVGYNANKYKKGSVVKVIRGDALVDVPNTQQVYKDGWYRHIEFSPDGEYILCAGLRRKIGSNKVDDLTVVFDKDFNVVANLSGHRDSVLCARFISVSDGKLAVASCSNDNFVNVYEFTVEHGRIMEINEPSTSTEFKGKLFDLIVDGDDILVTCINGGLYRWHNFREESAEITADYRNTSGLYIVNSDLSDIDSMSDIDGIWNGLEQLNNAMPEQEGDENE